MEKLVFSRTIHRWLCFIIVGCALMMDGCVPQTMPLAILPMVEPEAAQLNLQGIDQYHKGEWEMSLQFFQSAMQANPLLVEAHFNSALALHQLNRHKEATQHFRRAGELDADNGAILNSTLYRNHLGLSSTLERHWSGGYRYHSEN